MKLSYKKLTKTAKDPVQAHSSDAGFDLFADSTHTVTTSSLVAINTGIAFDIPKGYFGKIEERSGFALKNTLKLKAGVVDAGYQGEIKLVFVNAGEAPVKVYQGDKIAQIVIHKLPPVSLNLVEEFDTTTDRGEKGFGSSDTKDEMPEPNIETEQIGDTITIKPNKK